MIECRKTTLKEHILNKERPYSCRALFVLVQFANHRKGNYNNVVDLAIYELF